MTTKVWIDNNFNAMSLMLNMFFSFLVYEVKSQFISQTPYTCLSLQRGVINYVSLERGNKDVMTRTTEAINTLVYLWHFDYKLYNENNTLNKLH